MLLILLVMCRDGTRVEPKKCNMQSLRLRTKSPVAAFPVTKTTDLLVLRQESLMSHNAFCYHGVF